MNRQIDKQYGIFLFSINFASYKREPKVPHNSEVLKLLREREQEANNVKPGVEGMSELQENRNYNSNDDALNLVSLYYILSHQNAKRQCIFS